MFDGVSMVFDEIEPKKMYVVAGGANDTFKLGARVVKDEVSVRISDVGVLNGYRQHAWLELAEMKPKYYMGVEFQERSQ